MYLYRTMKDRLSSVESFKNLSQNLFLVPSQFLTNGIVKKVLQTHKVAVGLRKVVDKHQLYTLAKGLFIVRRVPFACC